MGAPHALAASGLAGWPASPIEGTSLPYVKGGCDLLF